jgi:hypothetical protein
VFTPTGSMTVIRECPSATLLSDGRVLVVGGRDDIDNLASAEVWDPLTAAFSPTGSLAAPQVCPMATLLRDGRVLIVGGHDAEIWDPATGTFGPAASPAVDRSGARARLLPDGRVLVTGGFSIDADGNGGPAAPAEAWDPNTDAWSPADSLPEAGYPAGTLLDDGRVLVITEGPDEGYGSATVWDPVTRSSTPTGSFEQGVALGTATRLLDSRVLFAGGGWIHVECLTIRADGTCHGHGEADHAIESAAIWDPVTGLFSPTGSLGQALIGSAAALLTDGRVLIVGGTYEGDPQVGAAEVFELK